MREEQVILACNACDWVGWADDADSSGWTVKDLCPPCADKVLDMLKAAGVNVTEW